LHKFLVSTARASVHFALQLFWILDAASVHMPGAVRMANLRDSVARVVGLRSALADDASDEQSGVHSVLNRSASVSVDTLPKPRVSTAVDRKPKRLGFFAGSALRRLDFRFAKPRPFSRSIDFGFENVSLAEAIDLESTANGSSSGSKPADRLPLLQSAAGKVRKVPILVPPLPVATADSAADEDEAAAATATVSLPRQYDHHTCGMAQSVASHRMACSSRRCTRSTD
jgi:hypothetical protein